MRLGEMLVRDGRVTIEQVEQAATMQQKHGGRIGTSLVEAGLIDLDALTVYLGLELGIPIASGATLEKAKRVAVQLLTPQQAAKFQCVPIVVQDRQLIVAVADPHDMMTLDEIARITGYRVIPRVAPELRVMYYVERYYGVRRARRFSAFGDTPRGNKPVAEGLPPPPLPGLPPRTESPVQPPTPAPELQIHKKRGLTSADLQQEDSELLEELSDDDQEPAPVSQPIRQPVNPTITIDEPETIDARTSISLEEALEIMENATERQEIAEAILSFTVGRFSVCFLGVVRDNYLMGWLGDGVSSRRLDTLLVPLEAPTIFKQASDTESGFYQGTVFPSTLHKYLFRVLEVGEPAVAVVFPISIGDRVVNMFYGQKETQLDPGVVDEMKQIAEAASEAYVGLIRRAKRQTDTDLQPTRDTPKRERAKRQG